MTAHFFFCEFSFPKSRLLQIHLLCMTHKTYLNICIIPCILCGYYLNKPNPRGADSLANQNQWYFSFKNLLRGSGTDTVGSYSTEDNGNKTREKIHKHMLEHLYVHWDFASHEIGIIYNLSFTSNLIYFISVTYNTNNLNQNTVLSDHSIQIKPSFLLLLITRNYSKLQWL